jgi:hypothetical protein
MLIDLPIAAQISSDNEFSIISHRESIRTATELKVSVSTCL